MHKKKVTYRHSMVSSIGEYSPEYKARHITPHTRKGQQIQEYKAVRVLVLSVATIQGRLHSHGNKGMVML